MMGILNTCLIQQIKEILLNTMFSINKHLVISVILTREMIWNLIRLLYVRVVKLFLFMHHVRKESLELSLIIGLCGFVKDAGLVE
jgi:hypothetical protein